MTLASSSVRDILACAAIGERMQLDSLWLGEGEAFASPPLLGAVTQVTKGPRLAFGIISSYTRNPMVIAQTMVSLDHLSSGRALLCISTGNSERNSRFYGIGFESPTDLTRASIEIIRKAFTGETFSYRCPFFSVEGARLGVKPIQARLPIYVASRRPRMLDLAATQGDGVLLFMVSPGFVKEKAMPRLAKGLNSVGKRREDFDVTCYILTSMSDDPQKAVDDARRMVSTYCCERIDIMEEVMLSMGLKEEVAAFKEAKGDRAMALQATTDRMVKAMTACGTAEDVRKRFEEFREAGVDLPIVNALSGGRERAQAAELILRALTS